MLERIIEYRNYARVKAVRDQTVDQTQLPRTALWQLVKVIEFALVEEEIARRAK